MTERIHNFSAGPAVLPESVLRQAQEDIWNLRGSGIGVLEHSHRGKEFSAVLEEAVDLCRKVGNIGDEHEVLFLQGGASTQFFMVPMNFLAPGRGADYLNTGVWSKKAIAEAKALGSVHVAYDGTDCKFDHIPDATEIHGSADAAYLHYTSNNTIYGTQYRQAPACSVPLVSDMSSDMFCQPIDFSRHGVVYAGAQKNLGPAGVTLVVIRKDFLEMGRSDIPTMLRYTTHAEQDSCYNTPPTFGIYIMRGVFEWILEQGGLEAMRDKNRAKAQLIYDAVDNSDFYQPVARTDSRSWMNVCFTTPNEELDKKFIGEALEQGMSGLKGHRSVGGLRASTYNACPEKACQELVAFMKDFARNNG